jgi:hypothetical protein
MIRLYFFLSLVWRKRTIHDTTFRWTVRDAWGMAGICAEEARERTRELIDCDTTPCPKCGDLVDDADGFGVLAHDACGYCSHPSVDGGVCGVCGEEVPE